jgi:hypothetical protein
VPNTGAGTYEYAVTTSATPPASGMLTSNTSVTITGLNNGASYYAHVRLVCSATSVSEWSMVPFTTGCKPPPSPLIDISVTAAGTASVKWNPVFGAASYQYHISNSATAPASGTVTTDTTCSMAGLDAETSYYVHVRSDCGGGIFSAWATRYFTTPCFMPVSNPKLLANSAGVTWNKIANAVKYEYALTANRPYPQSGYITMDTFYFSGKLGDGSGHYFHVRSICATGAVSDWSTTRFNIAGITAYPNPVKEQLTILISGVHSQQATLFISDAMGRVVTRVKPTGNTVTVDTRAWLPGLYFAWYEDGADHYTIRILKTQ